MISLVNYNYKRGFLRLTDECNRYVQLSQVQLMHCLNQQNQLQLEEDEFISYVDIYDGDSIRFHFESSNVTAVLDSRGLPWKNSN